MRSSPLFRTMATLLALWLPLVAGEPGLLQPCPMHGAEGALIASFRGASAERSVAPDHAGGDHAHHQAAAASSVETDHSPASTHDHNCCSCIDGCAPGAPIAFAAPPAPTLEVANGVQIPVSAIRGVESLPRPGPEYSRPYTTGPPRA